MAENSYIKVGDRVSLTPIDPWELVTDTGSGPFEGVVTSVDKQKHKGVIFKLDRPLTRGAISAEWFMAYTRHVEDEFVARGARASIFCYVDSITENVAAHSAPGPLPQRGELSMLGDVAWTSSL